MEAIINPAQPIIDAHHHIFPVAVGSFTAYPVAMLLRDLDSGHNIRATVYMETGQMADTEGPRHLRPVGETRSVNAIAEEHSARRLCAAIISRADLTLGGAVEEVLEAHGAAAPNHFRGVRHMVVPNVMRGNWVDERRLLQQPGFRAGLAQLARRDLIFETWAFHDQLDDLAAAAHAFPDLTVIADHLGGPLHLGPYQDKRAAVFDSWKEATTALARAPNVLMKLGGVGMWTFGFGWEQRGYETSSDEIVTHTAPYIHHAIEVFGPDRCLFESNFPVDRASTGYAAMWNAFKKIAAGYSPQERAAMFHDNAARVYRIGAAQ
jgi:predicted TIM-barrel fold metal-dependent hydrolase